MPSLFKKKHRSIFTKSHIQNAKADFQNGDLQNAEANLQNADADLQNAEKDLQNAYMKLWYTGIVPSKVIVLNTNRRCVYSFEQIKTYSPQPRF